MSEPEVLKLPGNPQPPAEPVTMFVTYKETGKLYAVVPGRGSPDDMIQASMFAYEGQGEPDRSAPIDQEHGWRKVAVVIEEQACP